MMSDMLKAVDVLHKKIHRFLIEKKLPKNSRSPRLPRGLPDS